MNENEIKRQTAAAEKIAGFFAWYDLDGQTKEDAAKDIFNMISVDPLPIIEMLIERIEDDNAILNA